jgi:hypothetical protein
MTRLMLTLGAITLAAFVVVSPALAVTYTAWQSDTLGPTLDDWGTPTPSTMTFNQFDTLGGTLTLVEVDWALQGYVSGTSQAENTDPDHGHLLTLNLSTVVSLYDPSSVLLGSITPTANKTFNATLFDGKLDFGGTSGVTYSGLSGTLFTSGALVSGLAPYIGLGTINYGASSKGASSASGSGNMVSAFTTYGKAIGGVRYGYTQKNLIPEPGTGALMLAGLAGAVLLRRRRSTK